MGNNVRLTNIARQFFEAIRQPHQSIDPCFMTGKACVYNEIIQRDIEKRRSENGHKGFMIIPFRQNVMVFFKNCLKPFLENNYSTKPEELSLVTADEVKRPGVIICEGVCKRIQESDFVVADISVANANVFYELGMAYGLDHKIIVIYHEKSEFGKQIVERLRSLNCRAFEYNNLNPIENKDFPLTQHLWLRQGFSSRSPEIEPKIVFYERTSHNNETPETAMMVGSLNEYGKLDDIELSFSDHIRSAIGISIAEIHQELKEKPESFQEIQKYLDSILNLKDTHEIVHTHPLTDVQKWINDAYCLVVRTGGKNCHPMAYFWLGYCHALGKNVIPITIIENPNDRVKDLAFDIRAQRHMTFALKKPDQFEAELSQTLRLMIGADFSEWSRRYFWSEILSRSGEISIFTGALHNKDYNREMIGDWDLRTVSELTSYFGRHQYRFKIESPIYPPEGLVKARPIKLRTDEYIKQLIDMIWNKNCILIASPDVNPLTEILLGTIYGVPKKDIFKGIEKPEDYTNAIVAFKERAYTENSEMDKTNRAFYKEIELKNTKRKPQRGFTGQLIKGGKLKTTFISQTDEEDKFEVYAHLAIIPNPYQHPKLGQRYIIILNGISGPATFALTHALTGGVGEEFVNYEEQFNPQSQSEILLNNIIQAMQIERKAAVECMIKVHVGTGKGESTKFTTYDWRRILKWELDDNAFSPKKVRPTTFLGATYVNGHNI